MKLSEVAEILAFVNSLEGRETTELEVAAWHKVLADVPVEAAAAAVTEHYETESRRIWPADIRRETVAAVGQDEWMYRS